jgi:PleD family two-component response regulator
MIVALVDDLMFRSRIQTAAKGVGADVRFVTSADAAVRLIHDHAPAFVIADLNATRLAPLSVVAEVKADPSLAATIIVGFVSHVDVATVDAAREAGVDEVMARSAFVLKLPELLARDERPADRG